MTPLSDNSRMKTCSRCHTERPFSAFAPNKKCRDGRRGTCRICEAAWSKKNREENIEERRNRERERRKVSPPRLSPEQKHQKTLRDRLTHARNPFKVAARARFATAVHDGRIKRMPCERCGAPNAQGHHEDYSKAFDVTWLCSFHHAQRHLELKAEGKQP